MPRRLPPEDHQRARPNAADPPADRAREVLQALTEIVAEAQKRGLPLSEAYVHFDQRDEGVVSVDDLMQAVVELRLCPSSDLWNEQDAEECVATLSRGKSRAYFTREDFVRYFSSAAPFAVPNHEDKSRIGSKRRVQFQKTSPEKREHLQHLQEQATAASHSLADPPAQKHSQLRVTLPEWAHARSKRALKELEAKRRVRTKPQPPLTLSSTPNFNSNSSLSESPLDSHTSNNEVFHDDDNNEPAPSSAAVPHLLLKKKKSMKAGEKADDLLEFPVSDRWKTFNVDSDTAISYGILSHDSIRLSPSKAKAATEWVPPPQTSAENTAEAEAQELYDRGIEGAGSTQLILERYERVLAEEEQVAQRHEHNIQRIQAKHAEIEAQRQAKEDEAQEREQREAEARRSILRRERESQQQFFEQMEAKKLENAHRLQENENMTLEDFRSRKVEDMLISDQERSQRNRTVVRQMGELEAERQEHARRESQVELQVLRLEEQKAQREALKAFQREFEQKELVSNPVEAYWLDAPAVYERFDDVASGARVLAADLGHFYKIKALQMLESAEQRTELEALQRGPLATKELQVRNLERVQAKAQNTGMIAKAGMGTVRIVPITPAEMNALGRELDTSRDELERLQSDASLRRKDLAWKDQLLQRVSVIIQRNERFREEVLAKLGTCADLGNERVLSLREDNEALELKRESLLELREKLKHRQAAVQGECDRAQAATTAFFDTSLRVVGALQRVQRTVIIKELVAEGEALSTRIQAVDEQEEAMKRAMERSKTTLEEVANQTFMLEESLRTLQNTTETKHLEADSSGEDTPTSGKTKKSPGAQQRDLAEIVRRTKHVDRTSEDKRWVTLDFLVNFAHYYKHVAPEEVEIIQKSADYQQKTEKKLTVEHLQRLMQLPARNCLAFAFLKSPEEMEAHYLLRKYTFGDGEEYFAQLDHDFEAPSGVAAPHAPLSPSLENMLAVLQRIADSPPSRTQRCPRARAAVLDDKMPPLTLLHVPQTQIFPHKSTTHSFQLPKYAEGIAILSLTVSIVFQGHFKSVGYQNGRLAAMMYMLPPVTDPSSTQQKFRAPIPIGKCFYTEDLALCSPHSMGKLTLRHEPLSIPLSATATYQVVLGAPVFTAYTLEVSARTALFADEALRRKRVDALKKQDLLPRKQDELQNIFLTIQLSERKKRLARHLATEAKDLARAAELELLRNNQKLERDNAEPVLSHEERRALHSAIQTANKTFTHCCFLFSKREEEVRDIEQSLRELTRIHVDVLEDCEKMEKLLAEYRTYLPSIAALLSGERDMTVGDAAAAKLARELNIEYVNKNGTKSSKARWAELSAMKAKLPSMMTPAERLRRKYKKGRDTLDKKEREWILLDRILHPRMYRWENDKHGGATDGGYTNVPGVKLKLHGAYPKLSKDEEQLAALSQMEVERIMKAPWNLLERKEILIRKIVTRFRDDHGGNPKRKPNQQGVSMVALLRGQKSTELTREEREWRLYDQLLNPMYYPVNFKRLAKEIAEATAVPGGLEEVTISPKITREDLVMAIGTPEEELYKLPSDVLRGRTLLLKYDPQLTTNLINASRIQQQSQDSQTATDVVEIDVDARCRLVFQELQRAIANTRNEFMDSYVLHSTLQRFPTKVLRLELEKDLDRLLISQIKEKEDFELANFLAKKEAPEFTENPVSDSDSDEEAVIAREVEARRKAKEDAKHGPKVRSKALKMKSLQKQRREIKNALQGRSLEEQRMILREQELGVDGCTACWTNPCTRKPFLEEFHMTIQERVEVIREELERVKHCPDLTITSSVCMAAVKSGNEAITLRKSDLFDELTSEVKIWEKNLRLKAVDEEFHETFRSKNEFFETQALHGFRQIQHKSKVQIALQREHNVLVAHLTAYEVVEDVLESMLEGWIFGERESERQVLGYVPSLKREGPLTMQDLRRFEQDRRILQVRQDIREEQLQNAQGLPSDKWKPIEVEAFQVNLTKKAVQKGSDMDKSLTETENALKFGLFCMTLMYFRGLSLLKKQKAVWSVSAAKRRAAAEPPKSTERLRMDKEKRNVELRARKAAFYDEKARIGQARKQKYHEQKLVAYRKRLVDENRKAKREKNAAINIQRVYRGHLGKIAGKKWMLRRREIDAQRALDHAAAVTLQRAYRGRLGRIAAEDQRVELAEFISQIRAEEAIDEEEEYWNNHKIERMARKVAAFVKKEA
ncbi:IQ motif, EF-hand binding site [Phytophthora cinnamomi]|uniref:IQ motif, EF-hand binding site n=1 Tax=Phytophthora cinnamomi TaxID=4785 RepID=UPI00355A3F21|nr:IQ motif, EF-hand binding site [Phytophthora cinnamomi]